MKNIYPKCATTFKQWCQTNKKYERLYKSLGSPKPFDVTLRDGIQSLSKEEQSDLTSVNKVELYYAIKTKYEPKKYGNWINCFSKGITYI